MAEQKEHNQLIWDLQDLMTRYGVTRSAISDWAIKNPDMKLYKGEPLPKGRYNILASDLAYIEHLKDKLENIGSRAKKIEVETEKLQEQVLLLKLERFEKQKKLMPVELIEIAVSDITIALRQNLLGIPNRLCVELSGITDTALIHNMIKTEVEDRLREAHEKLHAIAEFDDKEFIEIMKQRYSPELWELFDKFRKEEPDEIDDN